MMKAGIPASLSIPAHTEVARGTLRVLINKAEVTVEQFISAIPK
jgi:hypothetical protein